jgi:hypothetical protein
LIQLELGRLNAVRSTPRTFQLNQKRTPLMKTLKSNALFALLATTAAALSFPAMAQDPQQAQETNPTETAADSAAPKGGQTWASVDTDADGTISKTESAANAGLAQVFDQADADKDGKLTADEYKAYVAAQSN